MKTSRFLIHGFSKCFGLIVLFTLGIVWGSDVTTGKPPTTKNLSVIVTPTSATAEQEKDVNSTPSPEKHSDVSLASPTGSKPLAESPSSTPKSKDMAPKLPPKQTLAVTIPSVSHPEKKVMSTTLPSLSDQQDTVQSAQGTAGDISNMFKSKKPRQSEKETEMRTVPPQYMWDYITDCYPSFGMDFVDKSSFGINHTIIIMVAVFCCLVIGVCLYCCFKH